MSLRGLPQSMAVAPAAGFADGTRMGREDWIIRGLFLAASTGLCYGLQPFGFPRLADATGGLLVAALLIVVELRLRRSAPERVLGGAIGTAAGIVVALCTALLIARTSVGEPGKSCIEYLALFAFAYLGLMLGANRGAVFAGSAASENGGSQATAVESLKLLDTSVLIDGRIADICDAHFMDGVLCVPHFVLHELQMVADSGDALKRQRGRRGLEILQRMQKMKQVEVRILEEDRAHDGEVDDKLVELARQLGAKIVTNDFNLNKVASLQGIAILNVNLLANAMKPAVLPGEPMRVLIVREGKEPNQGVAYLDDGTMVVVDGARRLINKSTDVVVTSVHQTTAGKMIFGRLDERLQQPAPVTKQAAAAGAGANRADGDAP